MENKLESYSAYEKNEISANQHMTIALLFTAGLLFFVWFGYMFNVFDVSKDTKILTVIIIPIVILILCIPMIFFKSKFLSNPKYKYFVLFLFVFGISALNVIMPKHGILGWAGCIILTGHYYNPKVSRNIFITVLIMMLISLGLGTFIGEFDSNLLSGELNKTEQMIHNYNLPNSYPDTITGRYEYLRELIKYGNNRFVKIFTQYYLGRALFITLIFAVTAFLNKRTSLLLSNEIKSSNENQKNKTELEVAKNIQMDTLPAEMLDSKDIEIVGELKAAKEVGGDLFDYLDLDESHVAVLIGDVSGKGVPAAMFMMKTITSFRDFATVNKTPSQILKEVNSSIFIGNKASLFVTCFLAILDKKTGKVIYSNAGHNPPVVGSNGNFKYLKCNPGFLLGCMKDSFVKDEELTLKPGESLTLYTDGVTEARNSEGGFYGETRLLEVMNKQEYPSVMELHRAIKENVNEFVKDAPQSDDITLLSIKYRPSNFSFKEEEFDAQMANIPSMLNFIKEFANEHEFPEDFKKKIIVVGDELFSNIVKHGYDNNGGPILARQQFDGENKEYSLTIIDSAKAFNQLEINNHALGPDIDNVPVGGLGILIVKTIMNEYTYDRINDKNVLVLKKNFK